VIGASAIARDITERKHAEAAQMQIARLEQSQTAHRLLLERVFETEEQERRRIARELHDEAGQLMASVLVGLRALDDSRSIDEAKAQAQRLREIVVKAIDELGRLARGLHSSVLDDHGLGVALERYAADYSRTRNIAVNLALDELDIDPPAGSSAGGSADHPRGAHECCAARGGFDDQHSGGTLSHGIGDNGRRQRAWLRR
jgi:signal transduction histidine kinase